MTDDRFRLTALDARRWDFGNALRGYDRARVDEFRDQVADELERMSRTNQELETKVSNFLEQLRVFRDRDKALNEALVSAQQLRGEIRQQAEREAQLLLREAQAEADRIIGAVHGDVRRAEEELQQLWRTRKAFLAQMRTLVERQSTEIVAAESAKPPELGSSSRTSVERAPVERAPVERGQTERAPVEPPPAGRSVRVEDEEKIGFRLDVGAEGSPRVRPQTGSSEEPSIRPSMPTPSWLDAMGEEEPS